METSIEHIELVEKICREVIIPIIQQIFQIQLSIEENTFWTLSYPKTTNQKPEECREKLLLRGYFVKANDNFVVFTGQPRLYKKFMTEDKFRKFMRKSVKNNFFLKFCSWITFGGRNKTYNCSKIFFNLFHSDNYRPVS